MSRPLLHSSWYLGSAHVELLDIGPTLQALSLLNALTQAWNAFLSPHPQFPHFLPHWAVAVHPIVFYTCAQIISCWSNLPSIFCLSGQVPSTLKNNQTFPGEPSGPYNNTGFLCWAPFTLLNASLLLIAPECNKTNRSKQWVFAILGDPDSRNWVLVLCLGPC